ncbi:MAG: RNA 3'-terminal phosphate cyclase [Azonexus sp.]|nr:RNA 3'-terminal phosphate cyclase [Betaproteobacteria bacterium]MBK8919347.1 RNA 3'-terminal phosphate cyclase [Betaproteobacteria bacterium]MBP6035277.1 RNA 3'-terminal phosphate cyclase [Azonexus sp.]MBP6905860.1 RNA 3'-terminal phosphate cyclase [Azonexus sp.]
MDWIELDGSQGEGGGQILRTALSLSMITGIPFAIERIRAGRGKSGLLRQHLTAVQAAAAVCGARVDGAAPGSLRLRFQPGPVRAGDYRFAIGSAGSCTLVLQTVLPALWFAEGPSTLWVSGGTHNPAAPPADFLIRSWQPLLRTMGVSLDIELLRHGFYPAGGGELMARTGPVKAWQPLRLDARGALRRTSAIGVVAGVPAEVAKREMQRAASMLGPLDEELRVLPHGEGPGNVLMLVLEYPGVTEVFSAFGARGVPAETVADRAAREARRYRESGAAVGEHLADQLLLPLALAGGAASFTTSALSSHSRTNCAVIAKFLPARFGFEEAEGRVRVFLV